MQHHAALDSLASLDRVSQSYGRRDVLHDISLELHSGVTALLGPNGAGKSTLLHLIATSTAPREGNVTIAGTAVNDHASLSRARRHVGFLPQRFRVDPQVRVRDFVAYAGWLRGLPSQELSSFVEEAITTVDLQSRSSDRIGKLSGGMRQRVGVAASIVGKPVVVVLDEPTVGLDPEQRASFREIIMGFTNCAVLLSTHLVDDVARTAGRVVVLDEGTIRFDGSVDELRAYDRGTGTGGDIESGYLALRAQA